MHAVGVHGEVAVAKDLLARHRGTLLRQEVLGHGHEDLTEQHPEPTTVLPADLVIEGALAQHIEYRMTFLRHLVRDLAGA